MYYINTLKQEKSTDKTYEHNLLDERSVVDIHRYYMAASLVYDIFHLRETNVRPKIAQLIFSLHKDIVFCQVVIPYMDQFKDLEYTIKL